MSRLLYIWAYVSRGHWVRALLWRFQPAYPFSRHVCGPNGLPTGYITTEGHYLEYGRLYRHLWFWGCLRALIPATLFLAGVAAAPVPDASVHLVLQMAEGYRLQPYQEGVAGPWIVGIGHSLSANGEPVRASYTEAEVHAFFQRDLTIARQSCRAGITDFDSLPESAQVIALSVVWNCGPTGFTRFTRFRSALSARDYAAGARELERSKWASQVSPARVRWATGILRSFSTPPTARFTPIR